jgi:putative DNA primase/helicase
MSTHITVEEFLQELFGSSWRNRAAFAGYTPQRGWYETRDLQALDPTGDCYVSIAAVKPGKKRGEGAQETVFLVIDDVGEHVSEEAVALALGRPTFGVASSAAGFHWFYKLSTPVPTSEWPGFFGGIKKLIGIDTLHGPEAHHVYRLPMGVYSNPKKPERHGFKPHITEDNPDAAIAPATIPRTGPSKAHAPASGAGADIKLGLDDLREFMSWIKNDIEDRHTWVTIVGHGLKALCKNDEDGFTVFDEWSDVEKTPGYNREKWRGFGAGGLQSKGGHLMGMAQAANPDGFARMFAPKVFLPDPTEAAPVAAEVINFSVDQEKTSLEVVRHFAGRIRQVGRGDWREFNEETGRWREWTGDHMMRRVLELVAERKQIALDPEIAKKLGSVKFIEGIARAAGLHREVIARATDFDRAPLLLGVPSGVIDLRPGASRKIRKGRASEMVSKAMWVDPAPAGTPCPEWTRFLVEFTRGKPDLARWLQARAGYCLTGLMDEPVMPYYYGSGGNGKSVYLNALRSVWGEYGTQMDHRLLFEKQGGYHLAPLAVLAGVRLAVVTDVPSNAVWDVHIMKMLTGDDAITANRMHQNPITFKSTAKIDASGNGEPTVKDMDEGIRRRLKMLPMIGTPKVIDKQLGRKLYDEYPAILAWALAGLDEYWRLGGFPASEQVDEATKGYHKMLDPFQRWLDTGIEEDRTPGAKLSGEELYRSWDAFRCSEGAHNVSPANKHALGKKMRDKGFVFSTVNGYPYLRGYKLTKSTASEVF